MSTLIILNPHAANGRAGRLWTSVEPLLWDMLGELVVAITQRVEDVTPHLENAYASELRRVISIGGDGTNHALVNALAALNARHPDEPPMVYGMLPVGSGMDWARGRGIPYRDIEAAARWIASAEPIPTDIGLLTFDGKREHFLNIASAGIGGDVARRVNTARKRPWSYLAAALGSLLSYRPRPMQVRLDEELWFEGPAYLLAVANGPVFGHGMKVAPNATSDDGLFDVVLVEGMSRPTVLAAFPRIYAGAHLSHPRVRHQRARRVEARGDGTALSLELDGETFHGHELTFEVQPGLLPLLG